MDLIKVDYIGLKYVACKKLITLLGFYSRIHCSLGYFCCRPLVHLYYQLIVGNTTINYVGLSTLIVLYCFVHHSYIFYNKCDNTPTAHSATMEISKFFIFGKMCACLSVLGNIGKYNPLSIVDMIICPLGYF